MELQWQDEVRVDQKYNITPRWAKRGTWPSAPKDQRTTPAYICGAICPAEGKGAGRVLPRCKTEGMTLHLGKMSASMAQHVHRVTPIGAWVHSSESRLDPRPCSLNRRVQSSRSSSSRDASMALRVWIASKLAVAMYQKVRSALRLFDKNRVGFMNNTDRAVVCCRKEIA
jgi:hypothetical protein